MSDTTHGEQFTLSAKEDALSGVSFTNGALRFGPRPFTLFKAFGVAVIGGLVGIVMVVSASNGSTFNGSNVVNPTPLRILGAAIAAFVWFDSWNVSRSGVIADGSGLHLRNGRHRVTLPWAMVTAIDAFDRARDTTPAYGPDGVTLVPSNQSTVGFVVTVDDQSWALPGFESGGLDFAGAGYQPSVAEQRIVALRRYAASITNAEIARSPSPSNLKCVGHTPIGIRLMLSVLGLTALYGLNSWAAGRFVNPLFVGIAAILLAWPLVRKNLSTARRRNR